MSDVEYFGSSRPVPSGEACRSLASYLGTSEAEARQLLESGAAARTLTEYRGPFRCRGCGGSLTYANQLCRCDLAKPGESFRDRPMPSASLLSGDDAKRMLERRYAVPS